MPHTIGLIGHNGNVGSAVLAALLPAHKSGSIKLAILHRPSSSTSNIPSDVEKRVIDLEKKDVGALKSAVAGINILISNVSTVSVMSQIPLIEALAGSSDLYTFIPSDYGSPWTEKEFNEYPKLAFLKGKEHVADRAKELGVPFTPIKAAAFPEFAFTHPLFGMTVKSNQISLYRNALTNPFPMLTFPFAGAATAQLVVNHPKDIANKTFDLIEYEKTGEEIIQAFTEVNGSPPEIHEISEAEWEAQMARSGLPSLAAGVSRKWGTPDFNWTGERVTVEGWKGKTLTETVKEILNK